MKAAIMRPLAVLFCLVPSLNLAGQAAIPEPNWDRSLALQTIRKTDTQADLKPLYQMVRTGRNEELLDALHAIDQDSATPGPVRDFVVFKFTLGLSDLDTNAVSPEVLEFLSSYAAQTLVAHEEHPGMALPLFNIRAAAAGVQSRWDRQAASARAGKLLQGRSDRWVDQWVSSYLAASPAGRRGFVDALDFAAPEQLRELGRAALVNLDEQPELTLIVARAGLDSGDFELLRQSILRGGGPGLSRALKDASTRLSAEDSIDLLDHTLRLGSESSAALAIAQLAPVHLAEPEVHELLFATLADRNLGAAAAMVLGASPDPEIQARLNEIASGKSGLEQQRAELAIGSRLAREGGEL